VTVIDASAALEIALARPAGLTLLDRDREWHAPHLIDIEVLHALRRWTLRGDLSSARGRIAIEDYSRIRIIRYPHEPLLDRIWELKENVSAYDGAYIALAERLGCALVTMDKRMEKAFLAHGRARLAQPSQLMLISH
jgi:predicted nucleic acid-binding protein